MKFIADFHIHSKYSRATSKDMDLENLAQWAKIKGIKVLGTGDFSHPEWFKNLKEKLEPAEPGFFKLNETRFILTSEISCIYSKGGRVRKIHIIIFSPSFEICEKINTQLGWIGNLKSDGRPILGLDAKELAKIVLNISEDCLIVPAHCLLPDTYLHSNPSIKKIKDISVGDLVCTHKGRYQRVQKIYKRPYKGKIINIKPYYFRIGLKTTPEHPFYAIKTRWCSNMSHTICKKDCSYIKRRSCSHEYFKNYKPQWIQAGNIERGDVLTFPRFNNTKDIKEIKLSQYFNKDEYKLVRDLIKPNGFRTHLIPNVIKIDKDFCRLMGYYISEGYINSNQDSISFSFKESESQYIKDLKNLMKKNFGLSNFKVNKKVNANGIEIIYYSKILAKVFSKVFYNHPIIKRAHTKTLPSWILNLPLEKQVEIFKGWWYGDTGTTSSRELMNQMKIICLRLGIIPSISEQSKDDFNKKYIHKIGNRIIHAQYNQFIFYGLSFFQDLFGLLKESSFNQKRFKTKLARRHGWIDEKYIYIPVRNIEVKNYKGEVYNLEVEKDNSYVTEFATVHNCWTPWFSIFGSKSGFNSIEECFEDYSKYIYAGETGLSSNPKMNWRLSALDKITLISNSDAHSPQKIGREANVFETELSYSAIVGAIKTKDPEKFLYTIEFFPEEGKYHYDGHRLCEVRTSPEESKKYNNICPVCTKPLTIGVLNRIEELADRPEGQKPQGAIPFKSLVPLEEIIAETLGQGIGTKQVGAEYQNLIKKFGNEFEILLNTSEQDLQSATLPEITEGIVRVREGKVFLEPGYDGVFGKVRIFSQGEKKELIKQATLF